jgi:hypothetical protein
MKPAVFTAAEAASGPRFLSTCVSYAWLGSFRKSASGFPVVVEFVKEIP